MAKCETKTANKHLAPTSSYSISFMVFELNWLNGLYAPLTPILLFTFFHIQLKPIDDIWSQGAFVNITKGKYKILREMFTVQKVAVTIGTHIIVTICAKGPLTSYYHCHRVKPNQTLQWKPNKLLCNGKRLKN